jgi:LysM repeat protein
MYTVKSGDTLLDLAIRFDTTTEAISTLNNISEEDLLQLGQTLILPTPVADSPADGVTNQLADQLDTSSGNDDNGGTSSETGTSADQSSATTQNEARDASAADASGPAAPAFSLPLPPEIVRAPNINPLTGLPVGDPAILRQRPIMVRIGNDQGARAAQLGLNRADIVYEEITEWWVTRFSAIFLTELPEVVAPIRSARLINTVLGPQYQAAVAHSGGSDPVRWQMTQIPIANLDQWFHGGLFFHREGEGWMTRAAFKAGEAREYLRQNDLDATVKLRGFEFSPAISSGEPAPNIFIPFPRATSFTQWAYDPASGKYRRYIKDAPLLDASDGTQIAASNVIVYFAEHTETDIVEDSNGGTSIQIDINGRGKAWFFRDGKLNTGYWQTNGNQTPYFTLEDGSPYPLKPGNTWVEVVPTYFKIGLNSPDEASSRP